jgi:lipopolysaccharide export system permease protein
MSILSRYVFLELWKVFAVALGCLTLLMMLVGVVREAVSKSLPLDEVVRLMPYVLPDALRIAVPVTLLLATTAVYGRMSGSNELVAAKSLGISPAVFLWPTIFTALLLSLITVWLNDVAVSWGRNGARRIVVQAAEKIAYNMLQARKEYTSPAFSILVQDVHDRRLIRPTITLPARGKTPATTITADEAELRSDSEAGVLRIILRNVIIDVGGVVAYQDPGEYVQAIPLDDATRAGSGGELPSWMALRAIPAHVAEQRETIRRAEQELSARAAFEMLTGDFDALRSPAWQTRTTLLSHHRERLHRLLTEPHRRWSAGFSCLAFVWIGAPMAIRLRRSDMMGAFFACFAPILIVYYPLLAYGVDAAKHGTLPPQIVWAGNVLLALWGVWLFRRVIRY